MKRSLAAIALLTALTACDVEEIGMGDGSITVVNEDTQEVRLLISDNDQCVIGMHSSVNTSTRRVFSIGETSYVCLGEKAPGVAVENGKTYAIKGGKLVEKP
ncbi:MAG: hypothetical protein JXX28_06590 [Deltaproteobacteria bacterium]|nr:hypothetical protein [Deltaproteobacteria bacterium]